MTIHFLRKDMLLLLAVLLATAVQAQTIAQLDFHNIEGASVIYFSIFHRN